jgi:hypothetical protein
LRNSKLKPEGIRPGDQVILDLESVNQPWLNRAGLEWQPLITGAALDVSDGIDNKCVSRGKCHERGHRQLRSISLVMSLDYDVAVNSPRLSSILYYEEHVCLTTHSGSSPRRGGEGQLKARTHYHRPIRENILVLVIPSATKANKISVGPADSIPPK